MSRNIEHICNKYFKTLSISQICLLYPTYNQFKVKKLPVGNSGSERDLRMFMLQQKIAGCFRTAEGVQTY
jgi:hypothetical protein